MRSKNVQNVKKIHQNAVQICEMCLLKRDIIVGLFDKCQNQNIQK